MAGAKTGSRPIPSSFYVDERFYERLCTIARQWSMPGEPPAAEVRAVCERLLYREARLLDDGEFEQWLALFSRECAYWIPATHPAGDPRREVTLEFHDRRRLEDRVARIRTGHAYSQVPPTRTCHLLANSEMVVAGPDEIRARVSFAIHSYRLQVHRTLAGWYGYVLVREDNDWKIQVKQINLIDADEGQENNTFFL